MRSLRFFPDYGGPDPLWTDDGRAVSLDALPLTAETRRAVRSWAARWDPVARRQIDADDFAAGMTDRAVEAPSAVTWRSLEEDGRRLCAQIAADLGPDWSVKYEGPAGSLSTS
jgi:hypothetical protein